MPARESSSRDQTDIDLKIILKIFNRLEIDTIH